MSHTENLSLIWIITPTLHSKILNNINFLHYIVANCRFLQKHMASGDSQDTLKALAARTISVMSPIEER